VFPTTGVNIPVDLNNIPFVSHYKMVNTPIVLTVERTSFCFNPHGEILFWGETRASNSLQRHFFPGQAL
jgi:hypothetical protein